MYVCVCAVDVDVNADVARIEIPGRPNERSSLELEWE